MRKFKLGRIENTNDIDLLQHTVIPNTDLTDFDLQLPITINKPLRKLRISQVNQNMEGLRRSDRTRTHNSKFCGNDWVEK